MGKKGFSIGFWGLIGDNVCNFITKYKKFAIATQQWVKELKLSLVLWNDHLFPKP